MISTVSGGGSSAGGGQQLTEQPNSSQQQQQQLEKSRWPSRLVIRNRNLALAVLCCCAFMQNVIVGGANNAILSTIEKAYYMTSVESAIFLTMYDVSNIIASPIIGYFGDRKQKPKIIAMSMLGLCLAACVMVLPQFAATNNNLTPASTEEDNNDTSIGYLSDLMCNLNDSTTISPSSTTASSATLRGSQSATNRLFNNMKYVFYLANLLNGVASVALYTIVISYIEGMFSKEQVHMRQGVYYAIGAIGVGVGMLATGNFLNISSSLLGRGGQQSSSHSNSVTWIGAWWLIYIPVALIDLTLAGLVFLFSPDLAVGRTYHVSSMPRRRSRVSQPLKLHLADFARSARVILSNRVFVLIVLCTTTETFLIKGFSSYLAKYLEYQYRLAASTATMIVGALGFVSLMLGVFLGSFLVKHFKWQMRQCILFITAILSLTCFLFFGLLISGPQETYVNGLHPTYIDSACSCDPNTYYPVCYKNLYLFQTPCHAGCTAVTVNAKDYYGFTDCSVLDSLLTTTTTSNNASFNPSIYPCPRPNPRGYRNLAFISAFGFSILFLSSIIILPVLRVILESVSAENQSFALGIRSLVNKTLGNIPGPLMFAAIVDQSCIQWILNRNRTGKTCMLYNNSRFSMGLAFLGFSLRLCSAIFAILTLVQIRRGYEGSNSNQSNRGVKSSNLPAEPDTKFSTTCDEQLGTTSSSQMSSSTSSSRLATSNTNTKNESFAYLNKAYAIDTSDDVLVFKSDGQQMMTTTNDVPIEIMTMPENQKSSSQI